MDAGIGIDELIHKEGRLMGGPVGVYLFVIPEAREHHQNPESTLSRDMNSIVRWTIQPRIHPALDSALAGLLRDISSPA